MILINLLRFISCPCFHVLHNALANFRHTNQPQHAPAVCPGPVFDKYFCKYFKDTFSLSVSRDSITQHYTISRAMSQLSHLTRATLSSVTSQVMLISPALPGRSHYTFLLSFPYRKMQIRNFLPSPILSRMNHSAPPTIKRNFKREILNPGCCDYCHLNMELRVFIFNSISPCLGVPRSIQI